MKSNLDGWRSLHAIGRYYHVHPNYVNKEKRVGEPDLGTIAQFLLRPTWNVAVIGSGYGREVALIAPHVAKVFAIDVSEIVFKQMRSYLGKRKISNVVAVNAENWRDAFSPGEIDFVYSVVTFQHLTRDLARDYIRGFFPILAENGRILIQFSESPRGSFDAEDVAIEPNVRWTVAEIRELIVGAGFWIYDIRTATGIGGTRGRRPWTWHWAFFGKEEGR